MPKVAQFLANRVQFVGDVHPDLGADLRPRRDIQRPGHHSVVFNERHLRRLLGEYVAYYHQDRTHYALEKETPAVVFPLPRREPALLSWLTGGWAVCITATTGLRRRMGG